MMEAIKYLIYPLNYILQRLGFAPLLDEIAGFVLLIIILLCYFILQRIKHWIKNHKQRKTAKDLHPFFTYDEVKRATQYYIATRCQNIAPSTEHEPGTTYAFITREKLVPFFIKKALRYDKSEERFYIILADSGMGKTTFMINLYRAYTNQWFKKYNIMLLPLGHPGFDEEIDKIDNKIKENTILLLDAYDEDTKARENYKDRMNEILDKAWRFRKVVISCRDQFFPTAVDEPKETGRFKYGGEKGEFYFRKMYISPFSKKDISKYLNKKYGILKFWNLYKKIKAKKIIHNSPDLMVRPMLLNYIDDLLKANRNFEFPFQIYEALIEKWIVRESETRKLIKSSKEEFIKELYEFSRKIAIEIYRNQDTRKELVFYREDILPFAQKHGIKLEDWQMKGRSLLNRNATGQYKFSHKSIFEYFLALEAVNNQAFRKELDFEGMQQAKKFYIEMGGHKEILFLNDYNITGYFRFKNSKNKKLNQHRFTVYEILNIEYLNLQYNQFADISPLKELKNLTTLYLSYNQLTDINPLKELKNLIHLNLSYNQLTDINPLKELKNLIHLNLSKNQLTDINPLKELKNLIYLNLSKNQLTDISSLKEFKNLTELGLSKNQLTDISPLKELKNLIRLNLSKNQLTDISPMKEFKNLTGLGLSENQLTDISPLKELKNLNVLLLDNNKLTDINPLKKMKSLIRLELKNNPLTKEQVNSFERLCRELI